MAAWLTSKRMRWTLGLLVAVGLLLLVSEMRRRGALYWYDVERDQAYRFGPATQKTIVQLEPGGFDLPQTEQDFDTAVLRVVVKARLSGRWFAPELRLSYGATERSITFEHGARGVRYINLAGLTPDDRRVTWTAHHLELHAQTTELFRFANTSPCGRRVLVLAPHPDDAEIAAFGVYACAESSIVTLTAGGYAARGYSHLVNGTASESELLAQVRAWDSVAVPRWAGVPADRAVNLGYPTARLQDMRERPQAAPVDTAELTRLRRFNSGPFALPAPAIATWESLVGELQSLIEMIRPEIVVTPHPLLDSAPDHQWTTYALIDALERIDEGPRELLLYTNHAVASEAYPYGPASSVVSLPPWFDERTVFGGIYSHPLTETRRLEKLFALEAMHDLRAAPRMGADAPLREFLARLRRAVGGVLANPADAYSYYRRAPRPNELFVTHPASRAADLRPDPQPGR